MASPTDRSGLTLPTIILSILAALGLTTAGNRPSSTVSLRHQSRQILRMPFPWMGLQPERRVDRRSPRRTLPRARQVSKRPAQNRDRYVGRFIFINLDPAPKQSLKDFIGEH